MGRRKAWGALSAWSYSCWADCSNVGVEESIWGVEERIWGVEGSIWGIEESIWT